MEIVIHNIFTVIHLLFYNAKTLVTTLLIIGTFVLCWIPLFTFQTILLIQVHINRDAVIKTLKSLILANKYLYMLLLVNSICDPIIYAVRLKEVQLGYKRFWPSEINLSLSLSNPFSLIIKLIVLSPDSDVNVNFLRLCKLSKNEDLRKFLLPKIENLTQTDLQNLLYPNWTSLSLTA
jgi:hypothetical protein